MSTLGTHADRLPDTLDERYHLAKQRLADACQRAGRRPADIILCAVTKNAEPDDIRRLIELGHRDFGENRVQQLAQRAALLQEHFDRSRTFPATAADRAARHREQGLAPTTKPTAPDAVRWHMIGHLQRNKARRVVEYVRLIHSLDSLRLAEELQTLAAKRDTVYEVLIQVNCSGEASKFGCAVPAAFPLAEQIDSMLHVRVRGLMTMAPYSDNPEHARPTFARCRELFEEMKLAGFADGKFNLLSMGMSGDYAIGVQEGANIVRIGSAIFGERAVAEFEDPTDREEQGDDDDLAEDHPDEHEPRDEGSDAFDPDDPHRD